MSVTVLLQLWSPSAVLILCHYPLIVFHIVLYFCQLLMHVQENLALATCPGSYSRIMG